MRLSNTAKRRPDYFLVGRRTDGIGGAKVVVLECKGTHATAQFAVKQLAKACIQVEAVEVGGKTPQSLMVAMCLSRAGVTAYVLDPPGEEDLWAGSSAEMDELLAEDLGDPPEAFERRLPTAQELEMRKAALESADRDADQPADLDSIPPDEVAEVEAPEVVNMPERSRTWFIRVLARAAASAALWYAGEGDAAAMYQPRPVRPASEERELPLEELVAEVSTATHFELPGGIGFRGTQYVMPLPGGGVLQVQRGIENRLYEQLVERRLGVTFDPRTNCATVGWVLLGGLPRLTMPSRSAVTERSSACGSAEVAGAGTSEVWFSRSPKFVRVSGWLCVGLRATPREGGFVDSASAQSGRPGALCGGLVAPGTELPPLELPPISRTTLALFAGASGDHNPIHIDIDNARSAGFDDVFAHGMLSMAYLGRLLTGWAPQSALRSFQVRFVAITPVHGRPTCTGRVVEVEESGGERLAHLELAVTLEDGTVTLRGSAVVAVT
ncbi:hypothetical protein GCM10011581_28350 [Saccharopolyspora subtropica]|uniref:MaoC-like domain-containing protein n=1 Tax=Saccharopolyspora thermophila TaxID=89367 RepID=A0A917NEB9_9PSEU|nr:hypothetical protein GCM10011581_28350 [Saccharopolyspora subtropica]